MVRLEIRLNAFRWSAIPQKQNKKTIQFISRILTYQFLAIYFVLLLIFWFKLMRFLWHLISLVFLTLQPLVFRMSFEMIEHTTGLLHKTKFFIVYVKNFFSLIHFLIVENHQLLKSTSHNLSVPLTLECVRFLSLSISFLCFNYLPDNLLCMIAI